MYLQRPMRSLPLPPAVAEGRKGPHLHTRLGMRASHQSANRGNRRRGLPPPGAGVRWQRPPIRADRRSSLTTASSRGGANALKRNSGWRREFRISRRFHVSDAAVSWPEWSQRPAATEARRASHTRRKPGKLFAQRAVFSISLFFARFVETRRPAQVARHQQKSNRKKGGQR